MDKGNQERKSELGEVVKMKDSKILDLQFVVMDDIVFKNIPFEDRINTKLTLSDYDWMNYVFELIIWPDPGSGQLLSVTGC